MIIYIRIRSFVIRKILCNYLNIILIFVFHVGIADIPNALETVKALKKHKDFTISNPNRARSLISSFAANMAHFHKSDGTGYEFIADCVLELDALNPQVASRLVGTFSSWRRYDEGRQALMKAQLEKISQKEGLSKDTFEVVSRSLK